METTSKRTRQGRALALCLLASGSAWAGGHFDVDDAGMLDPGQCQYELWGSRSRARGDDPAVKGQHIGPACRVGPVELGFNADRSKVRGQRSTVTVGPQLKWTFFGQDAEAPVSAALSMGASFDVTTGGRAGGQFLVPLTWRATDSLQLHFNLGSDWTTGTGARTDRGGVAAEWALHESVSLIAERNRSFGVWTSRIGARFSLAPTVSIDISAARTGWGPQRVRGVIIGLNHEFGRP